MHFRRVSKRISLGEPYRLACVADRRGRGQELLTISLDGALMPTKEPGKNYPSFTYSILIKDIVKDTLWIAHVLYSY